MLDLEKEFRTLRMVHRVLLILGVALLLGGLGMALVAASQLGASAPARTLPDVAGRAHFALDHQSQPGMESMRDMGVRFAVLGLMFFGCGLLLRYLLRDAGDDDSEITDQELFKAYAEQIAAAEREKQRKRKK